MKKITTVLISIVMGVMAASADTINNPCIGLSTNTICLTNPSVTLSPIVLSSGTVCPTDPIFAFTTQTSAAGSTRTDTTFVNCPTQMVTNSIQPTIISNSWIAIGPGGFTAAGNGLSATFTPTNSGSGIITFNSQWSSPAPCSASGTASVSAGYFVLAPQRQTNCLQEGSAGFTNITFNPGTNVCVSNNITASAGLTLSNAFVQVIDVNNCVPTITNQVPPVIVTNWWEVSGVGAIPTSGSGSSATFMPTNGGAGTVTFYATYSNPPPCTATATVSVASNFCAVKVNLTVAPATVTLCDNQTMTATLSCGTATAYKFEIRRTNSAAWCTLQSGANNTYASPARIAGRFKVRVTATINGQDCVSDEKDSEVQFPTYANIVADTNVIAKTDAAWASTKAATTPNSRREEGFWIRYNTTTCKYEVTATVLGATVDTNSTASVNLPPRPADSPASPGACDAGATYSVASFHTHTPMTYRSGTRAVGPSAADNNVDSNIDMVPGVVYDYVESPAASGTIPGGHPLNSAAQRYMSGLTRRPTP